MKANKESVAELFCFKAALTSEDALNVLTNIYEGLYRNTKVLKVVEAVLLGLFLYMTNDNSSQYSNEESFNSGFFDL